MTTLLAGLIITAVAPQAELHPFFACDSKSVAKYYDMGRSMRKNRKKIEDVTNTWRRGIRRTPTMFTVMTTNCLAAVAGYTDEMEAVPREEGLSKILKETEKPEKTVFVAFDVYDWSPKKINMNDINFGMVVEDLPMLKPLNKTSMNAPEDVTRQVSGRVQTKVYDYKTKKWIIGWTDQVSEEAGQRAVYKVEFPLFNEAGEPHFPAKAKSFELRAYNVDLDLRIKFEVGR